VEGVPTSANSTSAIQTIAYECNVCIFGALHLQRIEAIEEKQSATASGVASAA
jgi:hypothetical protein